MNWKNFKSLLAEHPDKQLQFKYAENGIINSSYHITEIKKVSITSVDCGGKINNWDEIIVQLWEPLSISDGEFMKADKALSIINTVEKLLPFDPFTIVKIEFGNSEFDTRQMYPDGSISDQSKLIVELTPDKTQCKANNRGQSCGTSPDDGSGKPAGPRTQKKIEKAAAPVCCGSSAVCC